MEHFRVTTGPQPVKLTIRDYELLLESGALDGYPHLELIEGVIVSMNSERSRHTRAKNTINNRLHDALRASGSSLISQCEPTIKLSENSLPEPDAIVVEDMPGSDDYWPGSFVRIVIEVADSTRANDIGYKYDLYGSYGVPEYWIFDVRDERIHIFWEPKAKGYRQQDTIALGERLDSRTIPGLSIETTSLY